jgi:RNA polymerase sigma factor (sigma-70 family)
MSSPLSCRVAEASCASLIPSRERTVWLSRHILPHEPALRAWLRGRVSRELDLDDVIQETYAVLAGLPDVQHIRAPRAYAFQTALSVVLQIVRRSKLARIDPIGDSAWVSTPTDEPSPESQCAARQDLRWMHELIRALPPRQREAFTLRKVEGLSQRQIAQRMGIAESTVEKHIAQALRVVMHALRMRTSPAWDVRVSE